MRWRNICHIWVGGREGGKEEGREGRGEEGREGGREGEKEGGERGRERMVVSMEK